MIYLQIENVSKSFNEKLLFENISLGIHKGQKIALIAKNGAGKSTLLKIIAGIEHMDSGNIVMRNALKIAYLDQNPNFNENSTILEALFESSNAEFEIIKEYEQALIDGDKKIIEETTDLMNQKNLWDYDSWIKQILSELGIDKYNLKIKELSGGQKKRLALAAVIICGADLLILDEPTNHLDLEMILWLEKYLEKANCTLLMVTHDRYFLDRVCNDIIELDEGQLFRYKGNYSYFLEKRNERIENENAVINKAQSLFRKELDWMRQTPQARTTKSKSRIETFYEIKEVASSKKNDKKIKLDFKTERLGKKIMEINYISKSYDNLVLFENFNYIFKKNEKVGIIGPNGCGKTTLLRILSGETPPDLGTIDLGETVSMGYYKQDGISFNPSQRVIDIAKEIAENVVMSNGSKISASEFLRQFLFTNEMQYTPVEKLSGGERRRLYLMTVLMKNPNFLILDEPTNDLDILTLNILEAYLINFQGCVLMVSHDRFFLDKIVDHLFVFEHDNAIKDFPGNYSQYLAWKEERELKEKKMLTKTDKKQKEKPANQNPKKLSYKEQIEYDLLEKEIENLETEKEQLEKELYTNTLNHELVVEKSERLGEVLALIDKKSDRWLALGLQIEQ